MEPTNDHRFVFLDSMGNGESVGGGFGSFLRNTDVFQLLNAIPAVCVLAAGTYAKTRFALARP
jgi:hypothetical protein